MDPQQGQQGDVVPRPQANSDRQPPAGLEKGEGLEKNHVKVDNVLWKRLIDQYDSYIRRRLTSSALRLLPDQIEDLSQNILVRLYKNWNTFDERKVDELYRFNIIIKWVLGSYRRTQRKQRRLPIKEKDNDELTKQIEERHDCGNTAKSIVIGCDKDIVNQIISELTDEDHMLICLKYCDELNNEEIADRIGISLGNVRVKLHRIMKKLRDQFDTK